MREARPGIRNGKPERTQPVKVTSRPLSMEGNDRLRGTTHPYAVTPEPMAT